MKLLEHFNKAVCHRIQGILNEATDDPLPVNLVLLRKYFLAYDVVIFGTRASMQMASQLMLCTCKRCLQRGVCGHIIHAESLMLPNRSATRTLDEEAPADEE